ncbi:MAG: ion transporter [Planctomycetota bacterium]|nr:ion transporter [Planctomycetota bacterium]MEC9156827.1 ion transporter [Planctomycetota bacterium]MED5508092.1 ion transporter [Planctomycetota bacterium]
MVLSRMFKRHLNQKSKQKLLPFEILMGGVSVYSIVVVIVQLSLPEDSQMRALFSYYDTMACVIFIMGIFFHFFTEPHRWRYLISWGVLDMASAIPGMPLLRFLRVIRVLRLLRIAHKPSDLNEAIQRAPTASLIYLMILVLLTIYSSCCAGVLYFEGKHDHTSINSGADALWFGLVTVSTVGYGGFIPETLGARICAALLMVSGIGVFASLAGFLLEPLRRLAQGGIQKTSTEDLASQITELQIMLQKHLEKTVEDMNDQLGDDDDESGTGSEEDSEEG